MTSVGILQIVIFFGLILACAPSRLGAYMARVFEGQRTFLHPVLRWLEVLTYKVVGREGRRGAALDAVHGVAAELQHLRLSCSPTCSSVLQGVLPFNPQDFGAAQRHPRSGLQHGRRASSRTRTGSPMAASRR